MRSASRDFVNNKIYEFERFRRPVMLCSYDYLALEMIATLPKMELMFSTIRAETESSGSITSKRMRVKTKNNIQLDDVKTPFIERQKN